MAGDSEVAWHHSYVHGGILLISALLLFLRPAVARAGTPVADSGTYFYNDRVVVLTFHDVQPVPTGEWSVTPAKFEQTLTLLRRVGFEFIAPPQLAAFVERSAPIPPNALLLTFDDGLEDICAYALPILERLQIPCLENVIGSRMDVAPSCLTSEQVSTMAASGLVWIGGHSFDLHHDEAVDDAAVPASMVLHQDESTFMRMMRLTDDAKRVQDVLELSETGNTAVLGRLYEKTGLDDKAERLYHGSGCEALLVRFLLERGREDEAEKVLAGASKKWEHIDSLESFLEECQKKGKYAEQYALVESLLDNSTVASCPVCGRQVSHDFVLCPFCGTHLDARPLVCPACSRHVDPSWRLCPYCGHKL